MRVNPPSPVHTRPYGPAIHDTAGLEALLGAVLELRRYLARQNQRPPEATP